MTAPLPVVDGAPEPAGRRRRWPWVVLILVVLLVALAVAAELFARQIVPPIVRDLVAQAIQLPEDEEIEVQIDGVLLPQLIGGEFGAVHLSSEAVTFGELTGAVEATATGVPVRGGAIGAIEGTFSIEAAEFAALLAASDLPLDEVAFEDGAVTLTGQVRVLGFAVPLLVGVAPDVDGGALLLRPVRFGLADAVVDAGELASRLGQFGIDLAGPYPVCIDDRIPRAVTLRGIDVDAQRAAIDLSVDGRIAVDPALQALGSCD